MRRKGEDEEDESWTQTLITVTPEEDAAIRRITETAVISSLGDVPLVIGVNEVTERWAVQVNTMRRDLFIDNAELEETMSHTDAGCQTVLQGVPKVGLGSVYSKDEACQTMYLGKISPYTSHLLHDMAEIMNEKLMPAAARVTEVTQTVVTFESNASKDYTVECLSKRITAEELEQSNFNEEESSASRYVTDNLQFVLDRVYWLSGSDDSKCQVELKSESVQTFIKYDYSLGKIVLDADTQTSLTCEPKLSNTALLSEWSAVKGFARDIIDECLEAGIRTHTIVYSILDEVVDSCAEKIHLPYRDEAVQTLARCNALADKDDVVLKKLNLAVVPDTMESSIIVLPLIATILEKTCLAVRQDAAVITGEILEKVQINSVKIATRLAAIRQELVSHQPMDNIFEARKKRLRELLRNKIAAKLCSGTQTELAGVPDLKKVKEPKETVCSTCMRHSECYVCETSHDNEEGRQSIRTQDTIDNRMIRTQDILIAYNPCYVVTTPSKIPKNDPAPAPGRLIVKPVRPAQPSPLTDLQPSSLKPSTPTSLDSKIKAQFPNNDRTRGSRLSRLKGQGQGHGMSHVKLMSKNSNLHNIVSDNHCSASGSLTDWARVVGDASSIFSAWSIQGSSSAESNTIPRQIGPSRSSGGRVLNRGRVGSQSNLSRRSVEALRILKSTFNRNEDSCTDCSCDTENFSAKPDQGRTDFRDTFRGFNGENSSRKSQQDIKIQQKADHAVRGPRTVDGQPCDKGFKVVPIIYLSNKITEK